MALPIPIYIGYDPHERAAVNVLADSLVQHSSRPLAITPIVARQLTDVFDRERHPSQSTEFSFSRFLVPWLQQYRGWAIFMDCDMLCRGDIAELWELRDPRHALMCVQHDHVPRESVKFLGAEQTTYSRKNWSSLMLFQCSRCTALTPEVVNSATGPPLPGKMTPLHADHFNHQGA